MTWKFCPHCGGTLPAENEPKTFADLKGPYAGPQLTPAAPAAASPERGKYDQLATWKVIMKGLEFMQAKGAQVSAGDLVQTAMARIAPTMSAPREPVETVVHLAFDRHVTPTGGVLEQLVVSGGRLEHSRERLEAGGYLLEDGKVKLVDDVPVGPAWGLLQYWGGEKQHRRWHLETPITVVTSRKGDPFFMDDNMIAFGATWVDGERMSEALMTLLKLFVHPPSAEGTLVAVPLALVITVL